MAPGSHFLAMYKTKVCLFKPKLRYLLLYITLALSNSRLPLEEAIQCICLHLASGFCPVLHTESNARGGTGGAAPSPWPRLILFLWVATWLDRSGVLTLSLCNLETQHQPWLVGVGDGGLGGEQD